MHSFQTKTQESLVKPLIQTKLKVGRPGDKYEQEADSMADKVMRMPNHDSLQMQPGIEDEENKIQMKPLTNELIQKKCAQCEEEDKLQMQPNVQLKSNESAEASYSDTNKIQNAKGGGRPLDTNIQQEFGSKMGRDFGNVKIHSDTNASNLNKSLGARAFTVGNDIFFNQGEYDPNSSKGKHLLAHELTHTIQQDSSIVRRVGDDAQQPGIETRYGLGIRNRFGLYDAILNRNTSTLTLNMRIAFNYTGPWPSDAEKTTWQNDFIRQVENRWSYRFYLVPMGTCTEQTRTFFARVNIEPVTSNAHYTVNVAHTTSNIRSSANSVDRTASLDSLDTQENTRHRLGQDFQQVGVEHEFGHMLGLAHIECDVTTGLCPPGDQYGDTLQERGDIMGSGWIVSERDYTPFTTAMYYFTGCNWQASHTME